MARVRTFVWMFVCVVAAGAGAQVQAAAYDFNGKPVDVEYWAGDGDNEALLVLDFGESNSFVFGYRWNDGDQFSRQPVVDGFPETISAATGEAMLMSIVQAGDVEVEYTYWSGLGFSVDSLAYAGHSYVSDWINNFASLWHSGNFEYVDWNGDTYPAMEPDGVNWIEAGLGATSLVLDDGFYHGWSKGVVVDFNFLAEPPQINFLPEPGSYALLAAGMFVLLKRRR